MIRVALDAFADRDVEKADVAQRARRPDRPREPPGGRRRALARRLRRGAGVRSADARHLPLRRADRRPRGRHRRAGRLPGDRRAAASSPTRRTRSPTRRSRPRPRRRSTDAARRTRLANERTYLAWWRTGLTSLAVAIGIGKIVPGVPGVTKWPYELVGAAYGLLGVAFMVIAHSGCARWSARSTRAASRPSTQRLGIGDARRRRDRSALAHRRARPLRR